LALITRIILEDIILYISAIMHKLMAGIHGNTECMRCGACCIYFAILNEDFRAELEMVFKYSDVACQYLDYDLKTRIASCRIHDSSARPSPCRDVGCMNCDKECHPGLRKVLENIAAYFPEEPVTLKTQ
jgi:hypothetical protein